MSNFDLDPFLNGPLTQAGKTGYNSRKFQPRRGRAPERSRYDVSGTMPGSPAHWGQQESGEPLTRGPATEEEERVRTDGGIPRWMLPEEHRMLVIHPHYETISLADGRREFYTTRKGEIRCSCGQQHEKYPETKPPEEVDGTVFGWDEHMLRAAGIDPSPRVEEQAVPEMDFWQ